MAALWTSAFKNVLLIQKEYLYSFLRVSHASVIKIQFVFPKLDMCVKIIQVLHKLHLCGCCFPKRRRSSMWERLCYWLTYSSELIVPLVTEPYWKITNLISRFSRSNSNWTDLLCVDKWWGSWGANSDLLK